MAWDMLIGDVTVGRLVDARAESGRTVCRFEPTDAFTPYAPAFTSGDISVVDDETLDAVIDEIAVDGVFLIGADGSEIVDPHLRIDGADAWFEVQSGSSR